MALGILLLESGGKCQDEIIPYLLSLEKDLHKITIQEKPKSVESKAVLIVDFWTTMKVNSCLISLTEIPVSENFSFCLNTLLSDVAVVCPRYREEIFEAQVSQFQELANMIEKCMTSSENPVAQNTKSETLKLANGEFN